jgi:hypothetical protein
VKPSHARIVAVLTVAAGAAVLFGPAPLAVTGGLLLALVLPGLGVTETLFRGRHLARVERTVLAPGLSLAVLVLAGLIIYVTGFTLDRVAWTSATVGVTLVGLFGATVPARWTALAVRLGAYLIAEDDDDAPNRRQPAAAGERAPAGRTAPARAPVGYQVATITAPDRDEADTLVLPAVVLQEQARATIAEPAARRPAKKAKPVLARAPRRLVWQAAAPLVLVLAFLGGASWLSYDSSRSSYDTTVTALSAAPSGPVNSAGTRTVKVTVSGLVAAQGPYTLVVSGARGATTMRRTIAVTDSGTWTANLSLPGGQRMTLSLYRAGDSTAYRTLFVSAVQ